jgi:hypothetical protein
MSSLTIQSINLINDQITVLFNQFWFQEDITTLRQLLLSKTKNLCIKETIIGADLENVRFEWKNTEFIINFDYYSQSCWFDTQDPDRLMEVHALFNLLTQDNKHYVV